MQSETLSTPQPAFLTYAQLVVSIVGFLSGILLAGLLAVLGLVLLTSGRVDSASTTAVFSMMWVSALTAVLALPSVIYSANRLRPLGIRFPEVKGFRLFSILMLLWPLVLILGNLAARQESLAWLILPPLQILAIGLPILWILSMVEHRLQTGSPQRKWGLINFSLLITTPLVVIVEILVFAVLFGLFVVYLMGQPELMNDLQQLAQRLSVQQPDPEALLPLLRPYLQNPAVIIGALSILSGLIPLLEELFKPLALWALANRKLTQAQGFAAGALCGGMFALLESLLSLTQPGEGWLSLAVGRAGTATLHITTTALIGWALASAWQHGTYVKLGLTYLLSSGIHGLWNAMSVFTGFSVLMEDGGQSSNLPGILAVAAPGILVLLVVLMLVVLWSINLRLRDESKPQEPVSIEPTLTN